MKIIIFIIIIINIIFLANHKPSCNTMSSVRTTNTANTNIFNNIKFLDKFIIKKGFYRECSIVVRQKVDTTLTGEVVCPQDSHTTYLSLPIDANDVFGWDD